MPYWLHVERHAALQPPVPAVVPTPDVPPLIDEPGARTTRKTLLTE